MAIVELKGIEVLSREDGLKMIDELARAYHSISGEEFVAAWDAGVFKDDPDRPDVIDIVMLLPFVR